MKRRILPTALVVVSLVLLTWLGFHSREPVYQGKTLPQWAVQFHTNRWPQDQQAEAAIKHFGTNGVPVLLAMMTREERPYRIWLGNHVPKSWLAAFHISAGAAYREEVGRTMSAGAAAFIAMVEDASPAMPGLIALLHHKNQGVRYLAAFAMRTLGPVSKPAQNDLIAILNDPHLDVRDEAVLALGGIHTEPARTVPILMEFVAKNRNSDWLCSDGMRALGGFGPDAKQAVPMLLPFLNDPRPVDSERASNAIMQIDPGSMPGTRPSSPAK